MVAAPCLPGPSALWTAREAKREPPMLGILPRTQSERGDNGIQLLLERVNTAQRVEVLSGQMIEGVRLRGPLHEPWWQTRRGRSFVLGGDLVRHAESAEEITPGDSSSYHVFCKLEDVDSFSVTVNGATRSLSRSTGSFGKMPMSALSAQLGGLALEGGRSESEQAESFTRRASAPVLGALLDTARDAPRPNNTVVHLVVRRSCQIGRKLCGREFELAVDVPASETAEALLRRLEAESGVDGLGHRLLYNGEELADKSLAEYRVPDGAVLELVPYEPRGLQQARSALGGSSLLSPQHDLFDGFQAARKGLLTGQIPVLASAGSGGSYFISDDRGTPCAVFKPADEEPLAEHNPRSLSSQTASSGASPTSGLRNGIFPGEGATREVAAFILDHDHFAGVPPTALVSCQESSRGATSPRHSAHSQGKVGSLQQFVTAVGDCEELGVRQFPVEAVHRIACLDMRLANTDRNASNILARRVPKTDPSGGGWELIPIDHAYCLPGSLEDISFEWLYWPQAAQPFSQGSLDYIARLDAEADLALLAAHGLPLREECQRVFRVATSLLKKGAARGLTPATIGSLMCRPDDETESALETAHACALDLVAAGKGEYMPCIETLLDALLDQAALDELT